MSYELREPDEPIELFSTVSKVKILVLLIISFTVAFSQIIHSFGMQSMKNIILRLTSIFELVNVVAEGPSHLISDPRYSRKKEIP